MWWSGPSGARRASERTARRNGYRHRPLDARVGTIDVAIPKLRSGASFPEWLLARPKRAESALIRVVADCYLAGVSTGRMDKLVKTLGINAVSRSWADPFIRSGRRHGLGSQMYVAPKARTWRNSWRLVPRSNQLPSDF